MAFDQQSPSLLSAYKDHDDDDDVKLKSSDGKVLTCSRRFLAAESGYFRSLFYSTFRDANSKVLNLHYSADVLVEMLNSLNATAAAQMPVWSLSMSCNLLGPVTYLQMDRLLPFLQQSITSQVQVDNLIRIYRYALMRDLQLADRLWTLLLKRFNKLVVSSEFLNLTPDELSDALDSANLNIESQLEAGVISSYLARHPREDTTRIKQLRMRHTGDGTDRHPVVMDRIPHDVLCAYGGWTVNGPTDAVEVFNPRSEKWIQVPGQAMEEQSAYHTLTRQDNRLVLCGGMNGREYFRHVRCYDMDRRVWSQLPNLVERRCYASSALIPLSDGSGRLMVIGGYNGIERMASCELVDPPPNGWRNVRPMQSGRSDGAAVVLASGVLAVGGFDGRTIHQECELFDVETNQWTYLNRRMLTPRSGTCAVALTPDVVMVVGGFNGRTRLPSCEFHDLREGIWHALPRMQKARSNHAVERIDESVYAMAGFDGVGTDATVERFDTIAQRWQPLPKMAVARSALRVVRLEDHDIIRLLVGWNDDSRD